MVSRTQMISMLKDAANAIVGTLTLVLQLSMNLIEMNTQLDEEEMPTAISQQLETMCQELNWRAQWKPHRTSRPRRRLLFADQLWCQIRRTADRHAAGSYQRQLAIAGILVVHAPPVPAAVEGPPNVTNTMPASPMPKGTPTSSHLTLAQGGQKKIT